MSDILDAAQQQMDNSTPLADTSTTTTVSVTEHTAPPPPTPQPMPITSNDNSMKKPGAPKGIFVAAIALLLLAILPVAVFFVSQQQNQIADIRSKASPACEDSGGQCVPNNYICTPNLPMPGYSCPVSPGEGSKKCIVETANCNPPAGTTPVHTNTPLPSYTPRPQTPTSTPVGTTPPETCESPNQCALRNLCEANGEIISTRGCGTGGNRVCCYFGPNSTSTSTPRSTAPPPPPPASTSTPTQAPGVCGPQGTSCNPGDPNACGVGCSAQNWACTVDPASGQSVCNQHGGNQCPGGSCTGIAAYHCNSAFGAECHDGKVDFDPYNTANWNSAKNHMAGCGQVDQVCVGGSRDRLGCGNFEISRSNCPGTNTRPPTPTSTPRPPTSTPIIGQCNAIHIYNAAGVDITQALINGTSNVNRGDTLTLAVAGTNATKAHFRVNGAPSNFQETTQVNNRNEFILPFVIPTLQTPNYQIEAEVFVGGTWK